MKKLGILVFILAYTGLFSADCCKEKVVVQLCEACDCKVSSKTFFSVPPLYQVESPELESLFHDRIDVLPDGCGGAFEATVFGSTTTNRANLASYFLPGCKTQLSVKGLAVRDENTDILAEEFNIITQTNSFESIVYFAPKQTVFGIGLTYRQAFARNDERQWWFGVSTPLTHVKNTMGFYEDIINADGGPIETPELPGLDIEIPAANMEQAFRQSPWKYGRIDCNCTNAKTALADITVEVGYEYLIKEYAHIESHAGVLIPTGNVPAGVTVFEPIVGHNKHVGVMFGTSGDLEIWTSENNRSLWFQLHLHCLYLFGRTEQRLVDVKGKPWSRYMEVYRNKEEAQLAAIISDAEGYTPGVNVFNLPLQVNPGFQRTINTSLIYTTCRFQFEAGYNLFCRPAECIKLACLWQEGPAFKAITGSAYGVQGEGFTNNQMTISGGFINEPVDISAFNRPVSEYDQNIIKACDLNLDSAAHPTMIEHTFFGAIGYRNDDRCYPIFAGIGGSYQFSEDNSGINRLVFWAKCGFSF